MDLNNEKDIFIYLDFNDKIPKEFLQNKMFIRVVDLKSPNPLIQINDMVFKGSYGHSIGTNIFFQRTPNQDINDNPYGPWTANNLELISTQTKTVFCKKMRVLPWKAKIPESSTAIKYNFKWDYKDLLKKFEDGTLDLKDMISQESQPDKIITSETKVEVQKNVPDRIDDEEVKIEDNVDETRQQVELRNAYENLQMLARKPLQRKKIVEDIECEGKYKKPFDYKSIECKVMERPFFSYFKNKSSKILTDFVDIDACVRLGILRPSKDIPRLLRDDEEKCVLKIENLDNLDLEPRYSIFSSYAEQLEKQVKLNSTKDNESRDIYGNTLLETLEIYRNLAGALEKRINEINCV